MTDLVVSKLLSARKYRAIGYYAKREGLRLALSRPPIISFMNADRQLIDIDLNTVLQYYDNGRKEDSKERQRKKKMESGL